MPGAGDFLISSQLRGEERGRELDAETKLAVEKKRTIWTAKKGDEVDENNVCPFRRTRIALHTLL